MPAAESLEEEQMARFVISPHFRLHEWVAEEKGYFRAEGLDYEFRNVFESHATPDRVGAYTSFEKGREANVSCACHWTVNVAASSGHGKLYADAYSVAPAAVFVPPESAIRDPADLRGVPISVGHQSCSHYSTLQGLEQYLPLSDIKLSFADGILFSRLEKLIDRQVPAAALFSGPYYFLEQLGFRKVIDSTFMMATMLTGDPDPEDVKKYFRALRSAHQLLGHIGLLHRAIDLPVQLDDDVARRAGRRDIAEPAARLVARDVLGCGGRIRPERGARRAGDGEQPQPPGLDVRRHAGDAVDAGLHLAADDVGSDRRRALVRNVREGEAAERAQVLEREVRKPAFAVRRHGQPAWIRPGVGDHLADRLERRSRVGDDAQIVGRRHRDGDEVLQRVVRNVPAGVRQHDHVAALPGGERVAVGRGFRDQVEAEHAARPRPVLHHDLLAEPLAHLRTDQPRHDVGGVAGRERNDDFDGFGGIGLPVSERSDPERERG